MLSTDNCSLTTDNFPLVGLGNTVIPNTSLSEIPTPFSILIDNAFVSLPALLVALTVKLNVFTAVGMPDIVPLPYSVNPVGRVPLSNDHVIGAVPVAVSAVLYSVPVLPLGNVVVVMAGDTAVVVMVMDNPFVSLPALFIA